MGQENPRAARMAELVPIIMGTFHDIRPPHPEDDPLTMRQYQALIITYAHGRLTLGELCEKLNLAPSTGTELANRMISKGYLIKTGGEDDRRKAVLRVSEKGLQTMQERRKLLTEVFNRFMSRFSEQDQQEFVDSFERIAKLIEKYRGAIEGDGDEPKDDANKTPE